MKVERNYATAYIRSILPEMCAVLGPADAVQSAAIAARQIGMQYHATVMGMLGDEGAAFAQRFARLLRAHGDDVEVNGDIVRIDRCSFSTISGLPPKASMRGTACGRDSPPWRVARWCSPIVGDRGDDCYSWRVTGP